MAVSMTVLLIHDFHIIRPVLNSTFVTVILYNIINKNCEYYTNYITIFDMTKDLKNEFSALNILKILFNILVLIFQESLKHEKGYLSSLHYF